MNEQIVSPEIVKLAIEKGFNWNPMPTQGLLQKWLRDVCKVIIQPYPLDAWDNWAYIITVEDISCPLIDLEWNGKEYLSYEGALEAALFDV